MDNMIGKRIKARRKELHLTQVQIKEKCGISNGNLSELENGNRLPSAGALISLSQVLGVSVDWILTGDDPQNISNGIYLNPDEIAFMESYRKLDLDDQEEIQMIMNLKLRRKMKGDVGSSSSGNPDGLKSAENEGVISA